jgi:lysophospholipase L1-like esterase
VKHLLCLLLFITAAYASPRNIGGTVRAYGDSITQHYYATNPGVNDYVSLLGTYYGETTINNALSGDTSCEMTNKVFIHENPTTSTTGIYTVMIGTNDATKGGIGAYEDTYRTCHLAALSWLALPRSAKVFAQDSSCVKSGTWAADNTYQTGIGESSSTNGSTLTCTITTQGNPIYIWYRVVNGNTGTFNYALDNGSTTSANAFTTPAIATYNSGTQSVGFIRIPNVAAGTHSVTFAATSSSGTVAILGIGSSPLKGYAGQMSVYSAGVPFEAADTLSSATAAYNADALADANLIAGDGGVVNFVNVRAYWCTNCASVQAGTGDMYDTLHPNDSGHGELATAFKSTIDLISGATDGRFIIGDAALSGNFH